MSDKSPDGSKSMDVKLIHRLVKLMKRYDLTAMDIEEGKTRLRLRRRGVEAFSVATIPAPPSHVIHAPVAAAAPPPTPTETPRGDSVVIESPMVGTYYASSSPDSPPFVSVGSTVSADTTVCIIEAMKVFTDIPAGVSGTIGEILVKTGQSVEYGQPLFRVIPN